MLLHDVRRMKIRLESLIHEYLLEDCVQGYSASQLNQPTSEDVINALRRGQRPEALYELLKQYVAWHRHDPCITTDKGMVLFIDLDYDAQRLSLYIGKQEDCTELHDDGRKKLFVMVCAERHDFARQGGRITKTKRDRDALVEKAVPARDRGQLVPALYFHVYSDPAAIAECTLRLEWIPVPCAAQEPASAEASAEASPDLAPDAWPVPEAGTFLLVRPGGGLCKIELAGSRLRPAADPRLSGAVVRGHEPVLHRELSA